LQRQSEGKEVLVKKDSEKKKGSCCCSCRCKKSDD
jgi:hypothetical protein